jgi:hypothetical protein
MTSCVEKLNVLLDHWAAFEKNNNYPELNYWKRVIKQEYEDDAKDAADAADAAAAEDADQPADQPAPAQPAPASAECTPIDESDRCNNKKQTYTRPDRSKVTLDYTTYCPVGCEQSNRCVVNKTHCFMKNQNIKGENSRIISKDQNNNGVQNTATMDPNP